VLAVHCLLHAEDRAAVDDLPPEPLAVRAVVDGPLAAAVSDAPDRDLVPEDAVDHLDLLAGLVAHVAVLPLALGTVVADDDGVREEILRPQAARFLRQLEGLRHLVELRVELTFDLDAVAAATSGEPQIRALAEASRAPGAGLGARMALGEAVAHSVAERTGALTEEWTQELTGLAERATVLADTDEGTRLAFLVHRDRIADADEAVARLRERAEGQAVVEYVGPLPAYSFLDEVDAASSRSTSRWGW
jgi:hypothetical protein